MQLVDPSFEKYVGPLIKAQWSPQIVQQFFEKMAGRERPYLRVNGVISGYGHLRFHVMPGEILNIAGPLGKSILRVISGEERFQGSILIREGNYFDEIDRKTFLYQMGSSRNTPTLYPELSVEQNWRYFARQYGMHKTEIDERVEVLSKQLGLTSYMKHRARELPLPLLRFADLGCALLHEPKLIMVEDPGDSLNPLMSRYFYRVLDYERQKGNSVIVAGATDMNLPLCNRQL